MSRDPTARIARTLSLSRRFLALLAGVALALVFSACGSSPTTPSKAASSVQLTPQSEIVFNIAGHTAIYTMTVNNQPYTGGVDCSQTQGGTATMVSGQIVFVPGLVAGLYPVVCIPTGMTASGTANVQVAKMTHIVYAPTGVVLPPVPGASWTEPGIVAIGYGPLSSGGTLENGSFCGTTAQGLVYIGPGDNFSCDISLVPGTSYYIYVTDGFRYLGPTYPSTYADGLTADGVPLGQTPDRLINLGPGNFAAKLDINTSYIPH